MMWSSPRTSLPPLSSPALSLSPCPPTSLSTTPHPPPDGAPQSTSTSSLLFLPPSLLPLSPAPSLCSDSSVALALLPLSHGSLTPHLLPSTLSPSPPLLAPPLRCTASTLLLPLS